MRNDMKSTISGILQLLRIHPVLVDVGASGGIPEIWKPISRQSIYIGFDPDLREMRESAGGRFHKEIVINEAVTSDPSLSSVEFYLTKSPFCSSTLEPDETSLANFHFHDLFRVVGKTTAAATTLDKVLRRIEIDRIDWLKADTQGTDLRIFTSLSEGVRSRILALDVEPGLIDAYRGEDLFVDAHAYLTRHGFWLSNLNVCGAVRIRATSLKAALPEESIHYSYAEKGLKKSPGWCEARYLRTLDSLAESRGGPAEYALLWIFSIVDGQVGFALDVALEYQRLFTRDEAGELMKKESLALLKKPASYLVPAIKTKRRLKRVLGRL